MKRWFLVCAVLLTGIFLTVKGFSATYDLTGEWDWTDYDHWENCGDDPEPVEQGTDIIIQNGNSFTVIASDRTLIGTVSGNVYSITDTWWEEGGLVTVNFAMTASSNTQYSGTSSWTWTGDEGSCSGGNKVSATRRAQNPPTYDATGTWDYSDWNHWNNCPEPNDPPSSGTDIITQTGNRITVVADQQETLSGFVNGSTYTFASSYPEDDGTTSDVYRVTLAAGSGTGTGEWVWNDDYGSCNGGFSFSLVKQQQYYTISGTVSQVEGVLMTQTGDATRTTTTNASGNYSFGNLLNGSYTVTPTKDGYRFEPASRNVTINNGDMTGIDFVAYRQGNLGAIMLLLDE
jgi:hypothetical protein